MRVGMDLDVSIVSRISIARLSSCKLSNWYDVFFVLSRRAVQLLFFLRVMGNKCADGSVSWMWIAIAIINGLLFLCHISLNNSIDHRYFPELNDRFHISFQSLLRKYDSFILALQSTAIHWRLLGSGLRHI